MATGIFYGVDPEAVEEKRAAEAFTRAVYKELRKAGLTPSENIQVVQPNTGRGYTSHCELCDVSLSGKSFLSTGWYQGQAYGGVCTDRVACQKRAQILHDKKARKKRLGKLDPSVVESWRKQWRAVLALRPEPPPKLAALDDDISLKDLMDRIDRLGPGEAKASGWTRNRALAIFGGIALAALGVGLLGLFGLAFCWLMGGA